MGLVGERSNTTAGIEAALPFLATQPSSEGIGEIIGLLPRTDTDDSDGSCCRYGFNANSNSRPPSGSSEYALFRRADLHR